MATRKKKVEPTPEPVAEPGVLLPTEAHPASYLAMDWLRALSPKDLAAWRESLASCSMTGDNRLAEICSETLRRLIDNEPVSDRYLLGLAWTLRSSTTSAEEAMATSRAQRKRVRAIVKKGQKKLAAKKATS